MSKSPLYQRAVAYRRTEVTFDTAQYTCDEGMVTIYKITKEVVALAPDKHIADQVVKALEKDVERDRAKIESRIQSQEEEQTKRNALVDSII